jgi:enoyl-CoA hydratase/carnithine racemase
MAAEAALASVGQGKPATVALLRPSPNVLEVSLARPKKYNACCKQMFVELTAIFEALMHDNDTYVVVLTAQGKAFTAGLDIKDPEIVDALMNIPGDCVARKTLATRKFVHAVQRPAELLATLPQATICAVQGLCIGAGVDFATACDIRYCSADAQFSIKEVDVGLAADLGTLHRAAMVCGNMSWVRELAFTGRAVPAAEAMQFGLVSKVCPEPAALHSASLALAATIAGKSPVAVRITKEMSTYAEDHSPTECLRMVRNLNGAMLQTEDIGVCIQASMTKNKPTFSKL